jgi:amino acid adenylation domain-containing protein
MSGNDQMTSKLDPSPKVKASKRDFVQALLRKKLKSGQDLLIQKRTYSEPPPLSLGQQRLWFLGQLAPDNSPYTIHRAWRIEGGLDLKSLASSINQVVDRHETLRTTFQEINGQAVQNIASTLTLPLPVVDLRTLPPTVRETEATRLATKEALCPFDLAKGPLFRTKLLRLEADQHIFLLTLHHMVSDGWSLEVLYREISLLYMAASTGQPDPLPSLPIQYADYAVWQREHLKGERLEPQLTYWRERLKEPLPIKSLPLDFPRHSVQTFRGAKEEMLLSPGIVAALTQVSRQAQTTLFMTMFAAFQVLLQRLIGEEDLCVGIPSSGRTCLEIEGLIGFFINTLVIRTNTSETLTFADLMKRVRTLVLEAHAHQDLPFDNLVEILKPERSGIRTPFFQVFFNMPPDGKELQLHGCKVKRLWLENTPLKFDLTVYIRKLPQGLRIQFTYNADLFAATRIKEMVQQYFSLLKQVIEMPDGNFRSYSLLTQQAQKFLPDPSIPLDQPQQESVTNLVMTWTNDSPTKTAIKQAEHIWSYKELTTQAYSIANNLMCQGLKPGDVVGILGFTSFGFIASTLGVLQCGGVFLFLDPALPHERLKIMVGEARVKFFLLIQEGDAIPNEWKIIKGARPHLMVDPQTGQAVGKHFSRPEKSGFLPSIKPDDPAYIFFTSGTTGTPKAILGTHQGLSHFLSWQRDQFDIGPQDRIAQLTDISFDVVLRDILLPLISGGLLCLPEESDRESGEQVLRWLDREHITVVHSVPPVVQFWLAHKRSNDIALETLRWLFLAGEPLLDQLVHDWRAAFPQSGNIVNLYGATETTLAKAFYLVPATPSYGVQPIGNPLPQTQLLIMTPDQKLCGVGELGEIVIRTPFRTLGYLNASQEQAQRFRPNPFTQKKTDLLYWTGDQGRYRLNGQVEILGRRDEQIKVRGVRVEPNEVMSALNRHPQVQTSFVMGCKTEQDAMKLVAYVVPIQGAAPSTSDIRTFVSRKLLPAMVPSAVVLLEALPRTPNGKVDRGGLPKPEGMAFGPQNYYVAPRTPTEEILVDLWQEVLNVNPIGIQDNFFDLGGYSLLATKLLGCIQRTFQHDLALRVLFEAPNIGALAQLLDSLEQAASPADSVPSVPAPRDQAFPLSFAQQRLWILDQFKSGSTAYLVTKAFRLKGPLNVSALNQSFNALVARHESLRTTFSVVDGDPVQVVVPSLTVPLSIVDLQGLASEEQETALQQHIQDNAHLPFDLSKGPLVRVFILQLASEDQIFLLTLHHIITDGWSMGILFRELSTLYQQACEERPFSLPSLPLQYTDFSQRQREWLQGPRLEEQLTYWRGHLSGLAPLTIPTDHPRPPVMSHQGQRQAFTLSKKVLEGTKSLSQQAGTTLFMTLLAAFQVLLARYSGQNDIAVGAPIANRTRPDIEGLIGVFVNTLVLRTDLSGNPSFLEVLHRVRERCLQAYAHQDVPFEKIVEALQPQRDMSRHPLFQVMFQVNQQREDRSYFPGLECQPLPLDRPMAKFDLNCILTETPTDLKGIIEFNIDLFEAETIARLSAHFVQLVTGIVDHPQMQISELPLLLEDEREQLLVTWNKTDARFPKELCVHQLFEAQVAKTPNAVAVVFEDQSLTYAELNRQANQLAHYLRKLGVGPDVVVGLCVESSLNMMVGLLGILKADGAFLPLDPALPTDRLHIMMTQAGMSVLLTQQAFRVDIGWAQGSVLCLDSEWIKVAQEPTSSPLCTAVPENLVYILFTSGSTGTPKGVAIEHRQLLNYVHGIIERLRLPAGSRYALVTPPTSDLGNTMLYPALCTGGELCIVSQDCITDPEGLAQFFQKYPPDCLKIVPSHLEALLTTAQPKRIVPTQRLILGGEACRWDLVEKVQAVAPHCRVFNHYGPTETTVGVASFHLEPDRHQKFSRPPLGYALPNTQFYVLDEAGGPVPVGVPGELWVGGEGVGRGYIGQPDLTADRFRPNPFGALSGGRMYRTGDRVRYVSDGILEFLGRVDHQVKLRGFRIELGEIEGVLRDCPGIYDAVVLLREDQRREPCLVAYLHVPEKLSISSEDLRQQIKHHLPLYMVPSLFVSLEEFPLTANGKVNRNGFPEPEWKESGHHDTHVAPRTPVEEKLLEVWQEVLGVETLDIHDNFFELGGHSLLAIKLITRMRTRLKGDLPVRQLFDTPTIAGLAAVLAQDSVLIPEASDSSLISVPRNQPLPLSFTQERFWLLDQLNPNTSLYHSCLTFRLRGELNTAALVQSLQEIVDRHEILRTVFPSPEGSPLQVIHASLEIEMPIYDLQRVPSEAQEGRVHTEIQKELQHSFDLAQGPLFRATLWKLGPHEHVQLLNFAHIISDAWSKTIMLRELSIFYNSFCEGQPSPLSPLTLQYADFAVWQRTKVQGESGQQQLAYWKEHLKKPLPVLRLPTDFPRPAIQTHRGNRVTKFLPSSLSQQIRTMCQQEHCSVFMILLATLSLLFSRYTGDEDLIIGAPTAGRNRQEWEELIGCFLNTLALRIDLSGTPTFRELLRRVRQITLEAQAHEDIPFEKLIEELQVDRDLSRSPLFQVFLNMHDFSDGKLPLADLEVSPFHCRRDRALFDLTLYFKETEDGLRLSLNYNVELYSKLRIEELLNQLHGVLEETLASPDFPIQAYSLVSSQGRIVLPNPKVPLATPPQRPLVQLIADWALKTPTHPAICFGNQSRTYQELMVQANTIACSLLVQGLQPGDVVAIFGPASVALVASLLGVLQSGGVFLLIDPALPSERQEVMLIEAKASFQLVIGASSPSTSTNGLTKIHLKIDPQTGDVLEAPFGLKQQKPITWPHIEQTDPAYIFFTSGSTGTPKAILGTHQGLSHFLAWQRETFAIGPHDRVAQLTGLSFDVILRDIFLPLTSGGVLCLPEESDRMDGGTILRWLDREQITVLHTVPTVAQYWLADVPQEVELSHLRWTFFSGEPLTDRLIQQWRKSFPQSGKQINLYGATETTLVKAFYQIPADPPAGIQPVGSPLPQTQLIVVTQGQQLCGIGELGEIIIRTPFGTLGYLNASQEQAQRFRPNPFTQEENDCWYWTGDLGRYRLDGTVEILGRQDDQVKIRGVRIEPGEVLSVLNTHPKVQASFVMGRKTENFETELVAYVVPVCTGVVTTQEIWTFLNGKLPQVLVPRVIVFLKELPRTPNGKVDRRALPDPEVGNPGNNRHFVTPRTHVEETLAGIWREVLALDQVDVHDNFFELGGHSLKATQIISRVRASYQVDLPLGTLFECPTIEGLAEEVENLLIQQLQDMPDEEAEQYLRLKG